MAKKKKGEDLYYEKMSKSADRIASRAIFCRICGQEVLLFDQPQDVYEWERKHQVHTVCARRRAMAARQPKK